MYLNGTTSWFCKYFIVCVACFSSSDGLLRSLDLSSRIFKFTLLASLELGSTLGHGEVLAQFEISVGELLNRDEERQRESYHKSYLPVWLNIII